MSDAAQQVVEHDEEQEPFAIVQGEPFLDLPQDLYIPPDALEVFLEAFEGPLDLLLYLIKRHNLDVLDVPIAEITRQYMEYIALMNDLRLELAAEYLVMAAMLAEIKSRMLLPKPQSEEDEDDQDPRAELIRRLQEYERFKKAAEDLNELPQIGRDVYGTTVEVTHTEVERPLPAVSMKDMLTALKKVLERADQFSHHHIQLEPLSVRERMSTVLGALSSEKFSEFTTLFTIEEGRMGVVVTLLAMLELLKEHLVELVQNEPYGPIYIKAASNTDERESA